MWNDTKTCLRVTSTQWRATTVKLGYNELGYNELDYNELGYNELGYNELGYNELCYNELGNNEHSLITNKLFGPKWPFYYINQPGHNEPRL